MPTSFPRLRTDARRNRRLVVDAATTVFLEQGPDAPLDAVARAAGVGIGTLYRRFPRREDLLAAVYEGILVHVLDDVRAARDTSPTAWDGLLRATGWTPSIRKILHLARGTGGAEVLASASAPRLREHLDAMLVLITELVENAKAEGTLRPDVETGDIVLMTAALSRSLPLDGDDAENAYRRAHAILADGLRQVGASVLPGAPVSLDDLPL